jgi:hypothetical protein
MAMEVPMIHAPPAAFILLLATAAASATAATAEEQAAAYAAQAASAPSPSRGELFFSARHGREWACASCHTSNPTQPGRHASTGRAISPMAPAFNPERFADAAKTEKWFRRNCNDVVGRECTPLEKADVLAWLMSLKK